MAGIQYYVDRAVTKDEWIDCMDLAWRTFSQFNAKSYSREGVHNFYEFVTDASLYKLYQAGQYVVFIAKDKDKIIGFISVRNVTHISLLFVDKDYHGMGVGTALMHELWHFLLWDLHEKQVTVHSSPYAVEFYHKLGFYDIDETKEIDGIIITPMQKELI